MVNQKTSLLVSGQLPEYVVDEFPNFTAFMEAYYEFLENAQGTQKNDLVAKAKDLRHITDVDDSISQFEDSFFNSFASLIPRDVAVDKGILIKHILPLYLAKGNEKSFKLLFRLLFNEEVEIAQPKTSVLRASDGKWLIENSFRIEQDVYSVYTGNGTTTTFRLAQIAGINDITVYVDGVIQRNNYSVRKESKKLIFDTAPAANAVIKVLYTNFDFGLFQNRKITGVLSGATAIIERTAQKTINSVPIFELFINTKNLVGTFITGENVNVTIIDSTNNTLITLELNGLSILKTINIIDGGANYNVGDTVIVSGGDASRDATAFVSEVFSGFINQIRVLAGGAGFKTGSNVFVVGTGSASLTMAIDAVDNSGANSANVFHVNTDRISDFNNVLISDSDYGFNASIVTENVQSRIIDALSFTDVTSIGPITNVAILFANAAFASVPTLEAESAPYNANGTTHTILSSHSIGRLNIVAAGDGYEIGDELIFTETQPMKFGYGAAAAVTNVSPTGAITKVEIQPSRIAGTANTFGNSNVTVIGTSTKFEDELKVGDYIMINNESRYINAISSNTSLNVNVNFTYSTTDKRIGKYYDYPIGGQNYNAKHLPNVTISTKTGANGSVNVYSLMGDGENLFATSDTDPGAILKIKISDGGSGYAFTPVINLTQSGDGTATANAELESTYVTYPGRWTTSDSIISASERVLPGREYYVDYSYVLSSSVEFTRFKDIFKNLVHPAGFIDYADYNINELILANNVTSNTLTVSNTISGTVNVVSGSVFVTGTGTKFGNVASVTITVGTQIAVNSEIRTVNTVISNTNVRVSSAFTQSANDQTMVIL
jgi:hypothetical protein